MDISLFDPLKKSIFKVLSNDPRTMPLHILKHKVFLDVRNNYPNIFIPDLEFDKALSSLMNRHLVGKNKFDKYFIDYLDFQETNVFGEGYLEINPETGNGYITVKKNKNEYKKSSYFVHKKNLNGAKSGDYVRFCELLISDKKHATKFSLIDAKIKEIIVK